MDDYIKREDVIKICKMPNYNIHDILFALKTIPGKIIPAADVSKNVYGDWVYQDPLFVDTIMCSVCGYNLPGNEFKTNFCPECGADMRGEKE